MIVINIFDYEDVEDDSKKENLVKDDEIKELPVRELQKQVVTIDGEIISQ